MIPESMLRAAAAHSCQRYTAHLAADDDAAAPHAFSPNFEKKIRRLDRKAKHPVFYHTMQRAASIALALLIAGSIWLRPM